MSGYDSSTMSSPKIPTEFLRGGPPPEVTVKRIDFSKTVPEFQGHFAAVIDNFMAEPECKELLRLAEETTVPSSSDADPSTPQAATWERAMINGGGGRQILSVDSRKSSRIIWDTPEIAQRLLDRMRPYLRDFGIEQIRNQPIVTGLLSARELEVWSLSRLNERLRFLRYSGGDYFRPHWDGCYITPGSDGKEKSLFTIHLYLNGEGEQDLDELLPEIERAEKEKALSAGDEDAEQEDPNGSPAAGNEQAKLLGGATSFANSLKTPKDALRVFPKTGSVLIFQQRNLLHSGDDVFRGLKFTVRTDVMYRKGI